MPLTITEAKTKEQVALARTLFEEYAAELDEDLCFQGFQEELHSLPGRYSRPQGFIYLASLEDQVVGCIALKPLKEGVCEMKRLYVRPAGRGHGTGRKLVDICLAEARKIGYREMWLDTLGKLGAAIHLYRSLGFVDRPPYYDNPLPDVVYLELKL